MLGVKKKHKYVQQKILYIRTFLHGEVGLWFSKHKERVITVFKNSSCINKIKIKVSVKTVQLFFDDQKEKSVNTCNIEGLQQAQLY